MKKDKIIKNLKERNDKLANQYRLRDIRCVTLEIENKKLQQENKQLKQRNKEIYDGFMVAIDEVCETDREKRKYKSRIDKAVEYIKEKAPQSMCLPDGIYDVRRINRNELLKILGDKENER